MFSEHCTNDAGEPIGDSQADQAVLLRLDNHTL